MRWTVTPLLLAALLASATAAESSQQSQCAFHCKHTDKYSYESGKSYLYDYTVDTVTSLLGTLEEGSRVKIKSKVEIEVSSQCEHILRLNDVELVASSRSSEFADALTKVPLRFSFQDGVIDHVCGAEDEPTWVMNFKRGVLSAFQNSMTKPGGEIVEETDITGKCKTQYVAHVDGTATNYLKTKDFDSCTHRPDRAAHFATSSYTSTSPIQSLPIMRSDQTCHQRFEDGLLRNAECEESHQYRPFSNHESGTVTKTVTSLVFISTSKASFSGINYFLKRTPLTFDSSRHHETRAEVEKAANLLELLDSSSQDDITPRVPTLFYDLVATLREFTHSQLTTLLATTRGAKQHKFLVDAILLLTTPASAESIRDLLRAGHISDKDADVWFTSLAFVKNPNPDIFDALATIERTPTKQAMLGVSALINNYCLRDSTCGEYTGVRKLLLLFEAQLGSACRAYTEEEKERIVVALKALGNAGRWVNADSTLERCYTEDNDMEIRVAALDAWRHTPCHYDRSHLMQVFSDAYQNTEVRIASYLAIMTCPTKEVIEVIQDRLVSEPVNHVSSFIWTHLTNLHESAAPGKLWMHDLIDQDLLKQKFNSTKLKFSRNFESSFFMNEINIGSTVESNVIFSDKSFLPRSAMFNLTMDLFGESINFFEIGGRFEGFEAYIERFFGPNGYYPEETLAGILKNLRQGKDKEQATILESILDSKTDEPSGSLYLRLFGNEMYYKHFHGLADIFSGYSNPMDLLTDLARKGNVDYLKSFTIVDTEFSLPSVSGLPITLAVNGTATVGLKVSGTFLPRSLDNINIEGKIHPSAAIQMASSVHVDAFMARSGVKMVSTLHTSTSFDGKIIIQGGRLIDVAFNMPKDRIEVLKMSNNFFSYDGDHEVQVIPDHSPMHESCTSATSFLGLRICGSVNYPVLKPGTPYFPLIGPMEAQVFIDKTDSHSSYLLQFKREKNNISFLFDTPESTIDRKVALQLSQHDYSLDINLYTPLKAITARGSYVLLSDAKTAEFVFTLDQNKYTLIANLEIQRDSMQVQYKPKLVITTTGEDIVKVQGAVLANTEDRKYSADLSIATLIGKPITFHAAVHGPGRKMNLQTSLTSPFLDISFKGNYQIEKTSLSSSFDIEYSWMNTWHTITHSGLLKWEDYMSSKIYSLDFRFKPSQCPSSNIESNIRTTIAPGKMETKIDLIHGTTAWSAENFWHYNRVEGKFVDITSTMTIKCPNYGIDYMFSYHHLHNNDEVNSDLKIRLNEEQAYEQQFHFNFLSSKYENNILITLPYTKISVEASLTRIMPGQYKAKVNQKIMGHEISAEATFKNKSTLSSFDIEFAAQFVGMGQKLILDTAVVADSEKANADVLLNINDMDYTFTADVCHTSLLLDVNFFRHMSLEAKISPTSEEKIVEVTAFWDKANDQSKSFHVFGMVSPMAIRGSIKYPENEITLETKVTDGKILLQAEWAPKQEITFIVTYNMGEEKSLSILVETPFAGFEKQSATVTFYAHGKELHGSINIIWRNTEHLSFSLSGKYVGIPTRHTLVSEASFSSSITGYEQAKVSLNHQMENTEIKSQLAGQLNYKPLQGTLVFSYAKAEAIMDLAFSSPFTENLSVSLRHTLKSKDLSISLEATYGPSTIAKLTAKGHVDISHDHDVVLVLKMDTFSKVTPSISANVNYRLRDSELTFLAELKANQQKATLNINCQKTVTGENIAVTGNLRLITPVTQPFTFTLSHSQTVDHFIYDIEMSRFWSDSSTVKFYAEGKVISINNFELSSSLSNLDTNAKAVLNYKFIANTLNIKADFGINGNRMVVNTDGILDTDSRRAKLNVSITSSMEELQDVTMLISHKNDGHRYETKLSLTKSLSSLAIDHVFLFTDIFNWENDLRINNSCHFKNKQSLDGYRFHHDVEYTWYREVISSNIFFDINRQTSQLQIDALIEIKTSFTKDFRATFSHHQNGYEIKSNLAIEVESSKKIVNSIFARLKDNSGHLQVKLDTPFFTPVAVEGSLSLDQKKSLVISVTWNDNKTTLTATGTIEENKAQGLISLDTTYLSHPVQIEGSYKTDAISKSLDFSFTYIHTFKINVVSSRSENEEKWDIILEAPIATFKRLSASTAYNLHNMPYRVSTIFSIDDHEYLLKGQVANHEIQFYTDFDGKTGEFITKWEYDSSMPKAQIHVTFKSSIASIDDLQFIAAYNLKEKYVDIRMKYASQELKLRGEFVNNRIIIKGSTPFQGWEGFGASLLLSAEDISAIVFKSDYRIEITGKSQIGSGRGQVGLTIFLPYFTQGAINIEAKYIFEGTIKKINFDSSYGSKKLSIQALANLEDVAAPIITLEIVLPFEAVNRVGGEAKWNIKDGIKSADIKLFRDKQVYHWTLSITTENAFKSSAVVTLTTPLTGWSYLNLKAHLNAFTSPYSLVIAMEKERVKNEFSASLDVNNQSFTAHIQTSLPGWRKIDIDGLYKMTDSEIQFGAKITNNPDLYELNAFVLKSKQTPKLNIAINTSVTQAYNIQLAMEADFSREQKEANITFTKNNVIYSLKMNGKYSHSKSEIKVTFASPIIGFTSSSLTALLHVGNNISTIYASLIKEDHVNEFSMKTNLNDNTFFIDVNTTVPGYENIRLKGDYTKTHMQHSALASFEKNNFKYTINGVLNLSEKSLVISSTSPLPSYNMAVTGRVGNNRIEFEISRDENVYKFATEYYITPKSISFSLQTPIKDLSEVSFTGQYEFHGNDFETSLLLQRNSEKFEFSARASYTPMKSSLYISITSPIEGWDKLVINAHYNIVSDAKTCGISVEQGALKVSGEATFNIYGGSFKIKTPFAEFESLGASYNLDIDQINQKLHASFTLNKNTKTWNFSAKGHFSNEHIEMRYMTPFEGYNTVLFKAGLDALHRTGEAVLKIGPYTFTSEVTLKFGQAKVKITTPFDHLKVVYLDALYNWETERKDASLTILYNDHTYQLTAALHLSASNSDFTMTASLPFRGYEKISIQANYDANNKDQLILGRVILNSKTYGFSLGGLFEDNIVEFTTMIETPVDGWKVVNLITKLNLAHHNENLKLIFKKDGSKIFAITGKFVGDVLDLQMRSPLQGLENLRLAGSLDRTRRSAEIRIIRDEDAEASITASFNSVQMVIKTPYELARKISWNVSVDDMGKISLDIKRNDNFLTIHVVPKGTVQSFEVSTKCELSGSRLFTLKGHLNTETPEAYLEAEVDGEKIAFHIMGTLSFEVGDMRIKIQTPFQSFQIISFDLSYNTARKTAKIEASSSFIHFKTELLDNVELKSTYSDSQEHNQIDIVLSPFSGHVQIRIPRHVSDSLEARYEIILDDITKATAQIKKGNVELFHFRAEHNAILHKNDIEVQVRKSHTQYYLLHLHQDVRLISLLLEKDGKQMEIKIEGNMNHIQQEGHFGVLFTDTLFHQESIFNAKMDLNLTTKPKMIIFELVPSKNKHHKIEFNIEVDVNNPRSGNVDIQIFTSEDGMRRSTDISGKWDFSNLDAANFHITAGGVHISGYGKLGLSEADFTVISTTEPITKISVQWKFSHVDTQHDHFFRIGDENTYVMGKLMGTFISLTDVDMHADFGVSTFMPDLNLNIKINQKWDNTFTAKSNFTFGQYQGHQKLKYLAEDLQKQFTFDLESTSNIPGFLRKRFEIEYDFVDKFEVKTLLSYEDINLSFDIDFKDLNPEFSSNSAKINLPYLGKVELTFKHDFRNKSYKSIETVVAFAGEKTSIHAKWTPSQNYSTLNGKLELKSITFGNADLNVIYDISDICQTHVEISFARNNEMIFSVKAVHKQTDNTLFTELSLVSPIHIIPSGRFALDTRITDILKFNLHMGYEDSKIDMELKANESKASARIVTTFESFKNIAVDVTYRMSSTKKIVTLKYVHGNTEISMAMELEITSKGEGEFKARINTPSQAFGKFSLDATWASGETEIKYTVNEVHYRLTGKYDLRSYDNSSFQLSFLLPGKRPIIFAASYNIKNLLNGIGKKVDKLASISFEFEKHNLNFNLKGFRNNERFYLQLNTSSSFEFPGDIMLSFDISTLNDMRHGVIESRIHGHHFKIETALKMMGMNDSHLMGEVQINDSRMAISITLHQQEATLSVGYGHGMDLTFSIRPRANGYKEGLIGKIDLNQLGYPIIEYEAEYGFRGENEFYVDMDFDLGNDKDIELSFLYNSEGVEARLNSLLIGAHRLRAKRSFSSTAFFTELGYNDYELKLKGGLPKGNRKHGLALEGEILGEKILIDILFHLEGTANAEGKFIIETTILDLHHIGGHFIWAHHDKKIHASTEIFRPFNRKPIRVAEIDLDLNGQIFGHANIDIAGHVFSIKSDLKGASLTTGYTGGIEIKIPFLSYPELNITTSIKAKPFKFMQADLKIVDPYDSHIFKVKYDVADLKKSAYMIIDSTRLSQFYVFDVIATSTSKQDLNFQVSFNDNKFIGEYDITDTSLKIALDMQAFFLENKHVILKLETKQLALNNMEGKILAVVDGKTHQINGSFKVEHLHVKGDLVLSSDFMEGTRSVNFDILIPTAPYTNLSLEINTTAKEVHSILFSLNLESGILLNAEVNIPYFSKRVLNLVFKGTSAGIVLHTPEGTHKAQASWRMIEKMPIDYISTLDLTSPLLERDYKFRSKMSISHHSVNSLFELVAGAITDKLEAIISVKESGALISFDYTSSEVDTHKGLVKMEFDFTDKAVASFEATFFGMVNKLEILINKNTNEFRINANSPLLPNDYIKVEATVDEKTPEDIKLKLALMDSQDTLSGVYRMTSKSNNDISATLKILTPFKGYQKMTFGGSYVSDSVNKIYIYSDSQTPFKFNVEATFSNTNDKNFFADVTVETPIKKFERIGAAFSIPFYKFEPSLFLRLPESTYQVDAHFKGCKGSHAVGAFLTINGVNKTGAEAELRTKVPYEYGYKVISGEIRRSVHLRTDSSFISFVLPSSY